MMSGTPLIFFKPLLQILVLATLLIVFPGTENMVFAQKEQSLPQETQTSKNSAFLQSVQTYEFLDILASHHGKVILVNFFASFCGPCRREIPELIEMRKEIPEEDLVMIGVDIDDSLQDAEHFVKSMGMLDAYPVYYGGNDLTRSYRIDAIPFNVIYNREGHIEVSEAGYVPSSEMKQFLMGLIRR